MEKEKIQAHITSTWKTPDLLENAHGPIIALDAEQDELAFNTYCLGKQTFCKLWQWQCGDDTFLTYRTPTQIQYWKYLSDCNWNSCTWKPKSELPKENEQVICWITETRYDTHWVEHEFNHGGRLPLKYLGTRIHTGYFHPSTFWSSAKLYTPIHGYEDIPWKDIFKWISIDDFMKFNDDPRLLPIDPSRKFDIKWIKNVN